MSEESGVEDRADKHCAPDILCHSAVIALPILLRQLPVPVPYHREPAHEDGRYLYKLALACEQRGKIAKGYRTMPFPYQRISQARRLGIRAPLRLLLHILAVEGVHTELLLGPDQGLVHLLNRATLKAAPTAFAHGLGQLLCYVPIEVVKH